LQFVTESAVVPAFEATLFSLAFASFYQVFQTTRALDGLLTALRATLVPLHAQLIFSLARNSQIRELVFNAFSHFIPFPPVKTSPGIIFTSPLTDFAGKCSIVKLFDGK
jgi:chromate transport protein ChrA